MLFNKNEIVSCIVIDVISNKDPEHINNLFTRMGANIPRSRIFNGKYLSKCPANSLIVKVSNPTKYMILYPFFSSHFALPVKPGEQVWAFFPGGPGSSDIGYWMSRRATDDFIEDPNFTFNERSTHKRYFNSLIAKDKNKEKSKYYSTEGRNVDSYFPIMVNTEGNLRHTIEPVQRIYKNPGDLLLQGSNNAQLVFTNGRKKETGTIIMTTGRGKTELTSLDTVENNIGLEESNKASKLSGIGKENKDEGKIDLINDSAYVILSENPEHLNERFPEETPEEDLFTSFSHFIVKSDEIRKTAAESIYNNTKSWSVDSESAEINADNISFSASDLNASGSTFKVFTTGWEVEMAKFFDIVEDLIKNVSDLTSGTATFATGVGPTGPATNVAALQQLLQKIKNMKDN